MGIKNKNPMKYISGNLVKNQEYSRVFNAIYNLCNKDFQFVYNQEYKCYIPFANSVVKGVNEKRIPDKLYLHSNERIGKRNPNKLYNSLSWFRAACKEKEIDDVLVLEAAKQICSSRQWLCIEKSDGSKISVEANAKGTESYCKKLMGKILDKCKEIGAKNLDCAFITLTCDPAPYKSLAEMWETYLDRQVRPVMENLRKNYGVEYICVLESTKNMRPHAHILMFSPKGLFPELSKLKNETVLYFGKLYNYVKSKVKSPIFKIKVVRGSHKVHYLTKYIGKGTTSSVFKILEEEKELSKEDRKLLYEFVFLTAFRKRKVLMTRKGCKNKKQDVDLEKEVSVLKSQAEDFESLPPAKQRAALNSICTNSLLGNVKTIYSMSYYQYKETFGHFPKREQDFTDDKAKIFEKNSQLVYAEENFYTLFLSFLQNPLESLLNCKFYWNGAENIYSRFTDGYNLNDDEDYIKCCRDLCLYYLNKCLREGYSLYEVVIGKINLSNTKKMCSIGFGEYNEVCSLDPKDVYMTYEEEQNYLRKKGEKIRNDEEKRQRHLEDMVHKLFCNND